MATHLVTGYAGSEHIKSEDQGSFNASFFGTGQFVMEAGSQLEASIIDNNTVRILDGDILMKGRHIRINPDTHEDMIIENGTAGMNRCDLIVMEYSKDPATGIETAALKVLKGPESSGSATAPTYTDGDILNGANFNQMPLYNVLIEGVVLVDIVCLFDTIPTFQTLAEMYRREFIKACETHLNSLGILDTMEEITANTQDNQLAGAKAVKELGEKTLPLKGTAEKAKALTTNAGDHNQPVYFKDGVPVKIETLLEADVLAKRPSGNFGTQFRTDLGLDASSDYAIGVIRTDEPDNPFFAQYSSGLVWVFSDTQGFLMPDWSTGELIVGGGSNNKINWAKRVAWQEDLTEIKSNLTKFKAIWAPAYYELELEDASEHSYFKALLKYICKTYPNHQYYTFHMSAHPNSVGMFDIHIYDTNAVNEEGVPQYASGTYVPLGTDNRIYKVYTYGYEFGINVMNVSDYLPLGGGTMTGDIHGNRGGTFASDGNIFLNSGNWNNWLTLILDSLNAEKLSRKALTVSGTKLTINLD